MKSINLFRALLFCCVALLLQSKLYAQELSTFSLKVKNKDYTLSKDIDPAFLGMYSLKKGENTSQWNLTKEADANFEWGILVSEGKFMTSDVMEYSGGKMVSYTAYTVIYKNNLTGKSGEAMLYEFEGKKYLDQAVKEDTVAANK